MKFRVATALLTSVSVLSGAFAHASDGKRYESTRQQWSAHFAGEPRLARFAEDSNTLLHDIPEECLAQTSDIASQVEKYGEAARKPDRRRADRIGDALIRAVERAQADPANSCSASVLRSYLLASVRLFEASRYIGAESAA